MTTAARATREVTMHVFRGDAKGGEFREYRVPVEEGMVVLDVIHRIQAHAGQRPRGALELQGGQVRLVQRRGQREAAPHVHDADGHLPEPASRSPSRRSRRSR